MIQLSADKLDRLKRRDNPGRHCVLLMSLKIAGTWYCITDADSEITYNGNTYLPGYLNDEDMDDFETTSDPKTNDIGVTLQSQDQFFAGLFSAPGWMNGTVIIHEQHRDSVGEILTKNVYQGLISDMAIDEESRTVDITISSVWADFEKSSGIKTNPASQQRFYPGDTAFEHCAAAQRKIYFGKEAPTTSRKVYAGAGAPGGGGGRFDRPTLKAN